MTDVIAPLFTPLSDSEAETDVEKRILPYTESNRILRDNRKYWSVKLFTEKKQIGLLIYRLVTIAEIIFHLQSKYSFSRKDSFMIWYKEKIYPVTAVLEEIIHDDEPPEWIDFLVHTQPAMG